MALEKRYQPKKIEPSLEAAWHTQGIYHYEPEGKRPVYSIDTPPPTVSGKLHLGHVYSYSQADFFARFQRMRGMNVFYPMGFDDNGLPTERLVEKRLSIDPLEVGREKFSEMCLAFAEQAEEEYRTLWKRLGLSVDWRYSYRTISEQSQRAAQHSFIHLYRQGKIYRAQAPAIWCPECRAAFAQADLEDRSRTSEYITLPFTLEGGQILEIATTRPELLAACVAVFVHPGDTRYQNLVGQKARVPFYGQSVPILFDQAADPDKGTGAVMCCTFGDQTDVIWWRTHHLPLVELIDEAGRMTAAGGKLKDLPVHEARSRIKDILAEQGLMLDRQPTEQSIRVHERCDTPVEFRLVDQWFIRVLDEKDQFLQLGEQIRWHPEFMHARYKAWVENLSWDWAISRQRYYGVPFPAWFCTSCGETVLAELDELPVDPLTSQPSHPCRCGGKTFVSDSDKMDTWATSSLSPQIVSGWLEKPEQFASLFPLTLRPQAHEIVRTWLFYSIVMSWYHFGRLPWSDVLISGWGIAGEGMGKISKSRGGGPMPPLEMIERYSADAVRYWAASTSPGRDAVISEEKIQIGSRLATKLWNVARFSEPFISQYAPFSGEQAFTPADRWILASCDRLVAKVTTAFSEYEYAAARAEVENFFWRELADNYIEMAKLRIYDSQHPANLGAVYALHQVFKTVLKLFAPLLPYVTEAIWLELFAYEEDGGSIHRSNWPEAGELAKQSAVDGRDNSLVDLSNGEQLLAIATAVRRYKSEHSLSLGSELDCLQVSTADADLIQALRAAAPDLVSVTRARMVDVVPKIAPDLVLLRMESEMVKVALRPGKSS